jgi:hypothetical protein
MALHKKKPSSTKPIGVVGLFDEAAVRACLALVDAQDEATVANIFAEVAKSRGRTEIRIDVIPPAFDYYDWKTGRDWVRKWVPKIAKPSGLPPSSRAELLRDINDKLQGIEDATHLRIGSQGDLLLTAERDTVANVCLRAFIPFLVRDGWSPSRIAQCQYDQCKTWFLRPEPKRGSVPQYCNPKHATLARVHAYRNRQEAKNG